MVTLYLALGSNLGQRLANLQAAAGALAPQVQVLRASRVFQTPPWGFSDQPAFLNQVLEAQTELAPLDLLAHLKSVESNLGRQPTFRNGPRLIDLDILFYGDQVVDLPGLAIPHPRLAERAFVLVPLAELAPGLRHPILGASIGDLLRQVDRQGIMPLPFPLPWGSRTYVMGILNLTPDSFSGDGLLQRVNPLESALAQAWQFVEDGADILDLGGESTRPGARPVSEQEEADRVLPVLEALVKEGLPAILSVDTSRAAVAEAALKIAPVWINDVWALRSDLLLAQVAARSSAPVILMHNRSKPGSVELRDRLGGAYRGADYENLIEDVKRELLESVTMARQAGIPGENIILDPGIGFGKSVAQNLELINRLDEIRALGYPILLGPSRKSFIGYTLNLPPEERMEGTAAASVVGILRGADIIRVHDVKPLARAARMADSLTRSRTPA